MLIAKTLSYYKREDIREAIIEEAKDKEVAFKLRYGFGKRPDVLNYSNDVLELAKKGMLSLHCSEELWKNPLDLKTGVAPEELNKLRKGWDLVIDLDCPFFEYSKLTAHYLVKALNYVGVTNVGVKFSGNKGFHIGIPWEAFPENIKGELVSEMFPDAPKKIAAYLKFLIEKPLREEILKREGNDVAKIAERVGMDLDKVRLETEKGLSINTDSFIEIDTLLISSRHLYRMPYSFHEKSGLISVPILPKDILVFKKESASPGIVVPTLKFLDREKDKGCAKSLLVRALDHHPVVEEKKEVKKEYEIPEDAIPEKFFPPCWFNMMKGLTDGKKRVLFSMLNFLSSLGWSEEQIRDKVKEWNAKNSPPLRENYVVSQLSYHFRRNKTVLPPNCDNPAHYKEYRVCTPDSLCKRIRNPVQYVMRKCQN